MGLCDETADPAEGFPRLSGILEILSDLFLQLPIKKFIQIRRHLA